jgi:hypothetical protein
LHNSYEGELVAVSRADSANPATHVRGEEFVEENSLAALGLQISIVDAVAGAVDGGATPDPGEFISNLPQDLVPDSALLTRQGSALGHVPSTRLALSAPEDMCPA